ncbi:MAG: DUF1349 domain-containing protein, partial [Planctomycetes bacterium]|nr:DUF1349 domain-containing protein [Planctomycetota bacterium]
LLRRAQSQGKLQAMAATIEKKAKQHPEDHRLAALAVLAGAAHEPEDQQLAPLLELLRSEDAAVGALAASALGAFKEPEVTESLARIAKRSPQRLSAVIGALARQDTPAAAKVLGMLLVTNNPLQRRQAQGALERMQTPEANQLFFWKRVAYDGFHGKAKLAWRVLQPVENHLSYDKIAGALTIAAQRGNVTGRPPLFENVFLVDNPAMVNGDFRATVAVAGFTPQAPYQQAALLCWNDEDNYLKFSYESDPDGVPRLTIHPEVRGAVPTRADIPNIAHTGRLWLRLTKCGNQYSYAASTDGRQFVSYGDMAWGDGRPPMIGLAAFTGEGPPIDVSFDSFEVAVPDLETVQLTRLIEEFRPNDAVVRFRRGDLYARRTHWKEAAADFAKGLELDPSDHWHWYRAATLYLQLEDDESYRRCCRELLQRFGATEMAHIAERVGKICSITPEPVSLDEARRLARQAVESDPQSNIFHWFLLGQGITDYRAGDYEQAIKTLTQCLEKAPEQVVDCRAPAHLFLAMALRRTGDLEGYARHLHAGRNLIEERFANPERGEDILAWNDWILAHLARREAESLAEDEKP